MKILDSITGAIGTAIDRLFGADRWSYRALLIAIVATIELDRGKLSDVAWSHVALAFVLGEAGRTLLPAIAKAIAARMNP